MICPALIHNGDDNAMIDEARVREVLERLKALRFANAESRQSVLFRGGRDSGLNDAIDLLDALLRDLSHPAPAAGWRTIESAPKDGRRILIATESHADGVTIASWDEAKDAEPSFIDGLGDSYFDAAAWMPLPRRNEVEARCPAGARGRDTYCASGNADQGASDRSAGLDRATVEACDSVEAFLADVRAEVTRARAKFPGDNLTLIALMEEVGELANAYLDKDATEIRKEAIQVACMAVRAAVDGDSSTTAYRAKRGLRALLPEAPAMAIDASLRRPLSEWSDEELFRTICDGQGWLVAPDATPEARELHLRGWCPWHGGDKAPVKAEVEVRLRDGTHHQCSASRPDDMRWNHIGDDYDIIAYRQIPAKAGQEEPPIRPNDDPPEQVRARAEADRRYPPVEQASQEGGEAPSNAPQTPATVTGAYNEAPGSTPGAYFSEATPAADAGEVERLARAEAAQRFRHDDVAGACCRSGFTQGALWLATLGPTDEQVERAAERGRRAFFGGNPIYPWGNCAEEHKTQWLMATRAILQPAPQPEAGR